MASLYIVGKNYLLPPPESIVTAMDRAGYFVRLVKSSPCGSSASSNEFAVYPSGSRLIVSISEDLDESPDVDPSSQELVADLVTSDELPIIRRLICVTYWQHDAPIGLDALLDYLCSMSNGRLVADDGNATQSDG